MSAQQTPPDSSRAGKLACWVEATNALRGQYPNAAPSDVLALAQWLHTTEPTPTKP